MLGSSGAYAFGGEAIIQVSQQQNQHSLLLRTPVPNDPMLKVNTTSHYKTERQGPPGAHFSKSGTLKNQTVAKT